MTTELITWLIPLPPILAFFLIILFTNRSKALSHTLAILAAFLAWLASMIVVIRAIQPPHLGQNPIQFSIPWLATGTTSFSIGIYVDPLTVATLFFVAWT